MPATGNATARATLRYDPENYTPYMLHDWPLRDLRREYTRLRDIAQKRIKRLRADPEGAQSKVLQIFPEGIPRISDMHGSRAKLESAMADLALFIRNPESTVSGVHKANRARAKAAGLDEEQDAATYMSIDDWMAYAKAQGLDKLYDSEELRAYYFMAGGYNLSRSDFEEWLFQREQWEQRRYENQPEPDSDSDNMRGFVFGGRRRF